MLLCKYSLSSGVVCDNNIKMPLNFIQSQKGKPLLIFENHVYSVHRETENKVIWRCVEFKKYCLVRCHTSSAKSEGIEVVSLLT